MVTWIQPYPWRCIYQSISYKLRDDAHIEKMSTTKADEIKKNVNIYDARAPKSTYRAYTDMNVQSLKRRINRNQRKRWINEKRAIWLYICLCYTIWTSSSRFNVEIVIVACWDKFCSINRSDVLIIYICNKTFIPWENLMRVRFSNVPFPISL